MWNYEFKVPQSKYWLFTRCEAYLAMLAGGNWPVMTHGGAQVPLNPTQQDKSCQQAIQCVYTKLSHKSLSRSQIMDGRVISAMSW